MQVVPSGQRIPQSPQLSGSLDVSTQTVKWTGLLVFGGRNGGGQYFTGAGGH